MRWGWTHPEGTRKLPTCSWTAAILTPLSQPSFMVSWKDHCNQLNEGEKTLRSVICVVAQYFGTSQGEREDREWDGWMASPTHWTWIWAISGRWWRIGKLGVLQSMGWQRVRHGLETERQWLIYIGTQQKLTQHCTSTISQQKINLKIILQYGSDKMFPV